MAVDVEPSRGGLPPLRTISTRDADGASAAGAFLSRLVPAPLVTKSRTAARRWLAVVAACDWLLAVGLAVAGLGVGQAAPNAATGFLIALAAGTAWVALIAAAGGYNEWNLRAGRLRARPVVDAVLWAGAAVFAASYLLGVSAARNALVVSAPIAAVSTLLLHRSAATFAGQRSRTGVQPRLCVVAGPTADVSLLLDHMRRAAAPGVRVVAVCTDEPGSLPSPPPGAAIYPISDDLLGVAELVHADTVIAAGQRGGPPLRDVVGEADRRGIDFIVAAPWVSLVGPRSRALNLAGLPMLEARPPRNERLQVAIKRGIDCAGAGLALLLLAPVMCLIAAAIRMSDGGPVLFKQTRVGKDASPFTLLKFRTMHSDAESARCALADMNDADGPLFKIRRDPRVTSVGRILRRLSLDELPQLVNVLRGSMSLVGPRPPLPSEVAAYDNETRHRLEVQPGITGLWQVSGRSNLSWADSVHYDLQYVDHWSVTVDLRLLWHTARAVISGRGAY